MPDVKPGTTGAEIPYPGPIPFERRHQSLFFGRDHEANELLALTTAHPAVLLYSQSGAGKTSLLNASLVPMLEEAEFHVVGPARVRGQVPEGFDPGRTNPYVYNALASLSREKADPARLAGLTLSRYLKETLPTDKEGHLVQPSVVIFDQFEELFTLNPEFWKYRRGFFEQVGEALADPFLRVIFAMREDYIAEMDPYESLLPEKLRTRFRLERLRKPAALEAITGPLDVEPWKQAGREFAPGVAEKLVENLREIPSKTDHEGQPVKGEFVEPVQLQVVCQAIWKNLQPGDAQITERHLEEFGDINEALTIFYEDCLKGAVAAANDRRQPGEPELAEGALRAWFDGVLLTETGKRGMVFRTPRHTGGIPNEAVDELETNHLIRAELRDGERWYELSHDRFIQPIKESYKRWLLEQPGAERTRLRLEQKATAYFVRRDPALLLDAGEVLEARRYEAAGVAYTPQLQALLSASETAIQKAERERDRELAAARQSRARLLKYGLAVMSLLLALSVGTTVYANRQRIVASRSAEEARRNAEAAEQSARVANQQRAIADSETERANLSAKDADEQRKLAVERREEAVRAAAQAKAASAEAIKAKEAERRARLGAEGREREAKKREDAASAREAEAKNAELLALDRADKAEKREQEAQAMKDAAEKREQEARKLAEAALAETEAAVAAKVAADERSRSLALEVEKLRGSATGSADDLYAQGLRSEADGKLEEAAKHYAEAVDKYRLAGDRIKEVTVGARLGDVRLRDKDYVGAREAYEAVLKVYRDLNDVQGQGTMNRRIGSAYLSQAGENPGAPGLDQASEYFNRALTLYGDVKGDAGKEARAATLDSIGDVHLIAKRYGQAVEKYREAEGLYEGTKNKVGEAQMNFMTAFAYQAQGDDLKKKGDDAASEASYKEALDFYKESLGDRPDNFENSAARIETLEQLGEVSRHLGKIEDADEFVRLADELRNRRLQQQQQQQQQRQQQQQLQQQQQQQSPQQKDRPPSP